MTSLRQGGTDLEKKKIEPHIAESRLEERYSRQILFRGIGHGGPAPLAAGRVAIVGCGATGSALASLLARAGVGTLRIIDRDYVEASNLQRQSLFEETGCGRVIAQGDCRSAKDCSLQFGDRRGGAGRGCGSCEILKCYLKVMDVILDGTDNFETRYLVNDYAVKNSVPWIYAAAVGSYGVDAECIAGKDGMPGVHLSGYAAGDGGDLRDLGNIEYRGESGGVDRGDGGGEVARRWAQRPNICARRCGRTMCGRNEQAEIAAANPRPGCRACGERDFVHLAGEGRPHITMCGRNSVQIHERARPIDFAEMQRRLETHGKVRHNEFVLKFWREPYEMTLFPDGRAIIKGTTDTGVARSLYARYVGS